MFGNEYVSFCCINNVRRGCGVKNRGPSHPPKKLELTLHAVASLFEPRDSAEDKCHEG